MEAMIEPSITSRCGIDCGACPFKASHGCEGCIRIQDPFWGHCAIKACAERDGLDHCGQCDAFPCDTLEAFAHDPEQGDEGERIRRCLHRSGDGEPSDTL